MYTFPYQRGALIRERRACEENMVGGTGIEPVASTV